ncbi:hypothetical protein OGM63_07210 [Plectonema radiosum NIES-515]|uniref:Uncharacterized protein n=1 Tax=Plectonema radiosum NIES-515 TaxID=2986073 RepID=A0ABT3AW01_9CYAN|nr:hypothetical protein [Plectonema radiosum]MCV3213313.1 hypothetical protein [Plectonema radiosum NIES-515]
MGTVQQNKHYQALYSDTAQQILTAVADLDNDVLPKFGAKPVRASVFEGEGWMSSKP